MATYEVTKKWTVEGDVTLEEAIQAANNEGYGAVTQPNGSRLINVYRTVPQPPEWDVDTQGKWYDSDEYKSRQTYAAVRLTTHEGVAKK